MLSDPGHGGWCAASCCLTAAAPPLPSVSSSMVLEGFW